MFKTNISMKLRNRIFIYSIFLLLVSELSGQSISNNNLPILPQKSESSVLFGKDIVIHDQPVRNQQNLAVCSAFNGWLYAVYSYSHNNGYDTYITFLRSTDRGITWNVLLDGLSCFTNQIITKLDIIACGNSISNLKIFMAKAIMDTLSYSEFGGVRVVRYQGEPFVGEQAILDEETGWYKDIALSSDQVCPANNSNPFNMAVLFSKRSLKDTIIFCSSSDGGMSFNNRRSVALSNYNLEKVSLSYGRSASQGDGRYFAAWEEKDSPNANTSHIYTAYTETDINSPFTLPVCIDSLNSSLINEVRNPVISCQASTFDNDSSNLTELLLFEKYVQGTNSWDIQGFYNLRATATNHFRELTISSSSHIKIQPDISFNPYDSNFMVTYFDSTDSKLPFLSNNVNMINPDSWVTVSPGYNDSSNITEPQPKVELDLTEHTGVNVWIKKQYGGKGAAMFDAPYSVYTGIEQVIPSGITLLFGSFPNPCSSEVTIWFDLQKPQRITITLYGISGHCLGTITDQTFSCGKQFLKYDISHLSSGSYFYTLATEIFSETGKIMIVK